MKSTRDKYEAWLRDCIRKRCPELEPAIIAAIDAFDAIQEKEQSTQESLAPIVEAALSSRRPVYELAARFFQELTGAYEEARDAVVRMSQDSRSHVRFNAILCIGKSAPSNFAVQLLSQGLRDKSAKVRGKAADWAGRLRMRELVPDLEQAASCESNAKARSEIDFELKLLRDGYILTPSSNGGVNLTTFSNQGGIIGRYVKRSELDSQGLQAILAELSRR